MGGSAKSSGPSVTAEDWAQLRISTEMHDWYEQNYAPLERREREKANTDFSPALLRVASADTNQAVGTSPGLSASQGTLGYDLYQRNNAAQSALDAAHGGANAQALGMRDAKQQQMVKVGRDQSISATRNLSTAATIAGSRERASLQAAAIREQGRINGLANAVGGAMVGYEGMNGYLDGQFNAATRSITPAPMGPQYDAASAVRDPNRFRGAV